MLATMKFSLVLWGLAQLLRYAAWRHPSFLARLRERSLVAQIKARDEEIGRWYAIRDGRISSGAGLRTDADVTLAFKNATLGVAPPPGVERVIGLPTKMIAGDRREGVGKGRDREVPTTGSLPPAWRYDDHYGFGTLSCIE